ncbi:MAG: cyclohexanecarboxylate-CoA ligase [SAR324 cluster bacterium]|nr:cyclohexanecarboxylate-CoA ligase [SAR324 cluster bacterium]
MDFAVMLSDERIQAMAKAGLWPDRLITDCLDEAVADCPHKVAVVDHNSSTGRRTTLSYRQLRQLADRMALGLIQLGVMPGDVVSYQLPNWWEFTALSLACMRIGAVANPLMPIFRERELRFMLEFSEAKVLVVPREFRGFDHPAMMKGLRKELPALREVLVVEGAPSGSFEAALTARRWEEELDARALFAERRPRPNDVMELLYTSGTTGEPKGVMHTHNTLLGNLQVNTRFHGLTGEDVVLMASPNAHQTGFLHGMVMPIFLKAKSVLQDIWSPELAARLIQDEGATFTMASTPFLADLTELPSAESYDLSTLRIFLCAGAPIPRVLAQQANERLDVRVVAAWGMTENGVVTATKPDDPPEKIFGTDGCAIPGMEVRIVDEQGAPVPTDQEGRLQARGMNNFVGYLKRPERYDHDPQGWFETGDLARMDGDGYIRIIGRGKDIIIRGGENVPVIEVEQLLYQHPAIQDVAVVGMPDGRLGERGCAFAVLREGSSLSFREMVAYLEESKMARQYFPERLEILQEFPRTASGKIQKFQLREMAANLAAE